jgi:hypothetical protein
MILIGLAGRKGSGKDTLAEALAHWWSDGFPERHGSLSDSKVYHMADLLKKFSVELFGISNQLVHGTTEQKDQATQYGWGDMPTYDMMSDSRPPRNKKMTVRDFLQYLGTEICRKMSPSIHVDATMRKIRFDAQGSEARQYLAVVADLRFPNECNAIRAAGGKIVLLTRGDTDKSDLHISENSLDDYEFDAIIDNAEMTKKQQLSAAISYLTGAFRL